MKTPSALALLALYFGIAHAAATQDSVSPPTLQQDAGSPPGYFHRIYAGTIGGKYLITVDLRGGGNRLLGSYSYVGKTGSISLSGTTDASGTFTMTENVGVRQTGIWSGRLSDDAMAGEWRAPDGSKKMAFEARKTGEIKLPPKQETLRNAAGVYSLKSVYGTMGANGMFGVEKHNGTWRGSSSYISSNATREGQKTRLSSAEVKLLNSLHIIIDSALAVRFFAADALLLHIPFKETGMQYNLHIPYTTREGTRLVPSMIYDVNENFYLAAIDGVDFAGAISLPDVTTTGTMVLSYDLDTKQFEMYIKAASCCRDSTFIFERK